MSKVPRYSIAPQVMESNEETQETNYGDNFQSLGWKAILLLQFQPQFECVIMIGIYISFVCAVMDATFAYSVKESEVPVEYTPLGLSLIFSFDTVYAVDIFLMITYRNMEWMEMKHLYDERHGFMVLLDVISTIPIDAVYYSLTEGHMRVIYTLRLRYVLRIFRFRARLHQQNQEVGVDHLTMELIFFLIWISLFSISAGSILYLIECGHTTCKYRDFEEFMESLYMIFGKICSKGFPVPDAGSELYYFLYMSVNSHSFFYVNGFVVGWFLIAIMQKLKKEILYENVRKLVLDKYRKLQVTDQLVFKTCNTFFDLFWKHRRGTRHSNLNASMITVTMMREISLDVVWDALKHSHLFRDQEVHFLRYLSPFVEQKFMIPGECIFKRNEFKSSMVFVVSGVIQILSEEDGETPILYLSGGTCIGETTLFVDHPSTCTVICQTYCELYVLERKKFIKAILKYPKICRSIRRSVIARYQEAMEYEDICKRSFKGTKKRKEVYVLKWLKSTLHELLLDESTESMLQEVKKDTKTLQAFNNIAFRCDFLDMLVITHTMDLITDTVFLNVTCPCILQPDSFIIITWNTIIFIGILAFAVLFPYYAFFQKETGASFTVVAYIISFLWVLDVYIKMSTGIKTREGVITKFSDIAVYNLQSFEFVLDIISLFPLEWVARWMAGGLDNQTYILLHFSRLLKFYKVGAFFERNIHDVIVRMYAKYIMYYFFVVYYSASLAYAAMCHRYTCKANSNKIVNFLHHVGDGSASSSLKVMLFIAMNHMTGFGLNLQTSGGLEEVHEVLIIIELFTTLLYIYLLSSISVAEALHRYNNLRTKEYTSSSMTALKLLNVSPRLCEDVKAYMCGQLNYNQGVDILYPPKMTAQLFHLRLVRETRRVSYSGILKQVPLFQLWPREALVDISAILHNNVLVPGKCLTYAGEVCREMHIILKGFCQISESPNLPPRVVGAGYCLSGIEFCCGIPVVNNVVTLTHVLVATAAYEPFLKTLQMYPELKQHIKNAASAVVGSPIIDKLHSVKTTDLGTLIDRLPKEDKSSFKNFGYNLEPDTREHEDFHGYYDQNSAVGFLRYVLLRHTIRPGGTFIRVWEVLRCCFAITTALLTPMPFLYQKYLWKYILLFLDATAWLDIVVRHHICYYDKRGIKITHPLKTAVHYWSHDFIVDLVGVVPFERIYALVNPAIGIRGRVLLQMTRLLQLNRFASGMTYLDTQVIMRSHFWSLVKYAPLLLICLSIVACVIINLHCDFDASIAASANFVQGMKCPTESWIAKSRLSKPLSPFRTYTYVLFVASMVVAGPGLGGVHVQNINEVLWLIVGCMIGYWIFAFISVKVISTSLYNNSDLTTYQDALRYLITFLGYRKIDPRLKHEVIEHFEHVWRKKRGKNVYTTISNFNHALRQDILFDVYGKVMKHSRVFAGANDSFLRSLLLDLQHEMVMKRGIITKVNNIESRLYFVYKGRVEVLGPDYNRMLVLPVGSVFGNLDNCKMSRQSLTMVAKGHVELLTITTASFYSILLKYHYLHAEFRKLIKFNTDYLLGSSDDSLISLARSESLKSTHSLKSTVSTRTRSSVKVTTYAKQTKAYYINLIWEAIILAIVCFFGFQLELYQATVQEHGVTMMVILYVFDCLFLVHIYFNFITAYEDEFGIVIMDKRQIASRYIRNCRGFPLHLASILPLELLAVCFLKTKYVWRVWSYGRFNRFLRVFVVVDYFSKKSQQLNINLITIRMMFLVVWVILFLTMTSCILILTICTNPSYNMIPPLSCNWTSLTAKEKFYIHAYMCSSVLSMLTGSSIEEFYPNSPFLSFVIVALMFLCRFLVIHFISEVTATLEMITESRLVYEENIQNLKDHMIRERTSPALYQRVWSYVKLLWKKKGGLQFPPLLLDAPYYLKEGVLNSMFGYHLRKHEVLKQCHTDLIRQIAACLRTTTYFPGDYIAFMQESNQCMYFIHEGGVDVLSVDELYYEKVDKVLHAGDAFGFRQGVDGNVGHDFTYRANRYTVVLFLRRPDWIQLLDFFPASKKIIMKHLERA